MDETVQAEETALDQSAIPGEAETTADQGGLDQDNEGAISQEAAQQVGQDTFLTGASLDPTKLPPEIQPIFKKMQGAYTKKMQEAARWREQAGVVDRFYNDRDFAFQTLAQWAAQNGYSISPVGAQHPQAQPATQQYGRQGQATAQIVEALKANLPPELQWMAESQAPAITTAVQALLQPLVQQLTQQTTSVQRQVMEREYDTLAAELSDKAPGWEEHEGDMAELLDFLQGQQLKHPKFGSKHQLLYNLVTGNAAAEANVVKRMNNAAKNRPSSGMTTGRTVSNLAERVMKAKSSQDAFRLAAQAAEGTAGR